MTNIDVKKLAAFFEETLSDKIKDIIVASGPNAYELYGRFRIHAPDYYTYIVYDNLTRESKEFSALRYAASWCTLVNANKHVESRRLCSLDLKLCSILVDMSIHRKKLKSASKIEARILYSNKLQEDSYKKKIVLQEIQTFINSSKTLQARKFTARNTRNFKAL